MDKNLKEMNKIGTDLNVRKRMYEIGYNDAIDDISTMIEKEEDFLLSKKQIKILLTKSNKYKKK
jgi:hypothetical protein